MFSKLQSILEAEGLSDLAAIFREHEITDSVLADLSDSDLRELGIDKMGVRKRLLAAFGTTQSCRAALASSLETINAVANSPAEATKEAPFINGLGMPFVPIPRFETRFCIWPVRVQDYEQYCAATGAPYPPCPFPQGSDHPVVGVTWDDSMAFCKWLTDKERSEAKIDAATEYRLPTDLEWSAAVGLPHEPESTPAERHLKAPGYPWGLRWPPPQNAGNYEHTREDQLGLLDEVDTNLPHLKADLAGTSNDRHLHSVLSILQYQKRLAQEWMAEWMPVDTYEYTSPVSAFKPNHLGIFDLGGNVWEWCIDKVNYIYRIARGASFAMPPIIKGYRVKHLGDVDWSEIRRPKEPANTNLPVENSNVYRSSYRHLVELNVDLPRTIISKEFGALIPGRHEDIPCGGIRVVISKL